MNYFAQNLLLLRKQSRVSQTELALHVNKRQTTIVNWEKGITHPDANDLVALHHFFGISIDDLLLTEILDVHLIGNSRLSKTGQKVPLSVHPSVHPTGKNRPYNTNLTGAENVVNEVDEAKDWVVVKLLKENSEKLYQLLFLAKKKGK